MMMLMKNASSEAMGLGKTACSPATIHSLVDFRSALTMYMVLLKGALLFWMMDWFENSGDDYMDLSEYLKQSHSLWVVAVANVFMIVLMLMMAFFRRRIRSQYQISGSGFNDAVTMLFCSWCAIAQEARHVDYATNKKGCF